MVVVKRLFFISIFSIILYSCNVERGGCTDLNAYNYQSYADFDNGSCMYTSDIVFYQDVAAAVYFTNNVGIDWLDLTVNGEYIGTIDAALGLSYIPDCSELDAITFSLEWQDASSSSFTWQIRDETGFKHYEGVESVIPNDCLTVGLTYKKIQDYKNLTK